jgi:hypothetical protein
MGGAGVKGMDSLGDARGVEEASALTIAASGVKGDVETLSEAMVWSDTGEVDERGESSEGAAAGSGKRSE